MKDLVYSDDTQVSDLICRKRNYRDNLLFQNLVALLPYIRKSEQVAHVIVTQADNREVTF